MTSAPDADPQVAGATKYQATIVPSLTREWAPRVVAAAGVQPGHRVLDVACGTGVLSQAAAAAVGPSGAVTGLDLDPAMLAVAARVVPGVSWQQGTAEALPFADETFDAVVSQFGLMFFPDRPAALREMWRVLRPGGRMVVAVWASLEETPAYAAEVALVERLSGRTAADVLRSPFALGDRALLEAVFAAAKIPLSALSTHPGTGRFANIRAMMDTDLTGWLPRVGVHLDPEVIDRIRDEAEVIFRPYLTVDGTVRFAAPAQIAVAIRSNR